MPDLGIADRLILDVIHLRRDREQALQRLVVAEVGAHLARVDVVLRLLDLVLEIRLLPAGDCGRLRVVLAQLREQLGVVALAARGRQLRDARDEVRLGLAAAEHLVGARVIRPVGKADQLGLLGAQHEDLLQELLVVRVAARVELDVERLAERVVVGKRLERDVVGIVGRDANDALGIGRMRGDPIGGQPGEPLRIGDLDRARVFRDVLLEVLAELRGLGVDRLDPRARGVIELDARELVVAQDQELEALRIRVGSAGIDGLDRVVDAAVEQELALELLDVLAARTRRVANGRVGMNFGVEARAIADVRQHARGFVERLERIRDRPRARRGDQLVDVRLRLGDRCARTDPRAAARRSAAAAAVSRRARQQPAAEQGPAQVAASRRTRQVRGGSKRASWRAAYINATARSSARLGSRRRASRPRRDRATSRR